MAGTKMVVVNGVRYRPEDAPEDAEVRVEADGADATVEHKKREPRKGAARSSSE